MRWGISSCSRLNLCSCRLIPSVVTPSSHRGAHFLSLLQSFDRDGVWERPHPVTTHHVFDSRQLQRFTGRCTLSSTTEAEPAATASPEAPATNTAAVYLSLTDAELLRQCEVDTYRASGPGGQHRNKTESAVRLRHKPTGCVSQSCEQRSQHMNRETALGRLRQAIALQGNPRRDLSLYATFLPLIPRTASVPGKDHWIRFETQSNSHFFPPLSLLHPRSSHSLAVRSPLSPTAYAPSLDALRVLPASAVRQQKRQGSPPIPRMQHIGPNHPDFHKGAAELLDLLSACGGSVADAAALLGVSTAALSKVLTAEKALLAVANDIRAAKVRGWLAGQSWLG